MKQAAPSLCAAIENNVQAQPDRVLDRVLVKTEADVSDLEKHKHADTVPSQETLQA